MNFLKNICFLLLILVTSSCREKFDDNLTGSNINVLVVEGAINDGPGPYMVKLSQSVSFISEKHIEVKKAEVFVIDDLNNRYDFKEKPNGLYFSDSASFRGQMGRIYTLFINTTDSLNYKSTPCTIGQPSQIDSVYFTDESETYFDIHTDISFKSDQRMSTKIDADLAVENIIDSMKIKIVHEPFGGITHKVTHYSITYYTINPISFIPVLKTNTDYVSGSKIKNIPLYKFYYPVIRTDTTKIDSMHLIAHTSGLNNIFIIKASTISNETFNYYYNLSTQIKGENTFFEPIPVQLTGNIKCINNSKKTAYGLFQANALVKKYYSFTENGLNEISGIPLRTRDTVIIYEQ